MDMTSIKRSKLIRIFGLIVLLVIGAAVYFIISRLSWETTDDAYVTGRIHSIAPKIYGTVSKVYVDDNQNIKKGDLLLEIDPADYELKVRQAQAAVDAEKSRLLDAEAGIRTAIANLDIRQITLNQAGLDKQRGEALYKDNVVTKEKYEKIITAYDLAAAEVKAAKEQLEKAKSTRSLEESVIKEKEAALNIAGLNLSYTKIYSPTGGYITSKAVEVGNQVQLGQPLMAVVALDDIWVIANFKETQLKNVLPGQDVLIKIDTYPGRVFRGKVDSIMAGTGAVFSLFPPENALGNYVKVVQRIPVKIVFDKSADGQVLRIGMSCVPTIIAKNE